MQQCNYFSCAVSERIGANALKYCHSLLYLCLRVFAWDDEKPLEKYTNDIHSKLIQCIDRCIGKPPTDILMVEAAQRGDRCGWSSAEGNALMACRWAYKRGKAVIHVSFMPNSAFDSMKRLGISVNRFYRSNADLTRIDNVRHSPTMGSLWIQRQQMGSLWIWRLLH